MTTLRLLLLTSLALAPVEARCGDASAAFGPPVAGETEDVAAEPQLPISAPPTPARPIWGERRPPEPRQAAPQKAEPAPSVSGQATASPPRKDAGRKPVPHGICERELARAAAKYQIPLQILYAVALTESGTGSGLQPLMLHIEGKDHLPASLPEALAMFRAANDRGVKLIDIGCMQVNWYWHREEFQTLEEIFDPRLNVEQGARFLKELRQRHGSWTMAVARYNAGPANTVGQHRYVCKVMKNLVAAGVGEWTATSEAFCAAPPVPPEAIRAE
ncbi:transglycosylase SLT domain-containing protein [Xanthobacter sp.]|uniref:lytic transglycosylase domain-containing protein n=1 Tax=Xanthobacter sp. TaxID=35809 RepID=UPI0035B1A9AC